MNKTAIFLSLLLTASLFSSCGNDDKGDGSGHLYDVTLCKNPQSLDPQYACDAASNTVIKNLYSGLMRMDETGNVVCGNAESYRISDDGMVYTFTLNGTNMWFYDENHDDVIDKGEYFPVTAYDYQYALRRILDPKMDSPYQEEFSCIMGAEEVIDGLESPDYAEIHATDEKTLIIVLNAPNAEFLSLMTTAAAYPCNEDFFKSTKGRYGLDDKSVMSNGAFFVRQWFYDPYGSNNILYMKRNDANWTDNNDIMPSLLSFAIKENEEEIRQAFKDEETECFTTMNASLYNPEKYLIEGIPAVTLGLVFNPNDEVFSVEEIRKAFSLSIDRSELSSKIDSDLQSASGIIPPALAVHGRSYRELVSDKPFCAYNSEQAVECYEVAKSQLQKATFGNVEILVDANAVDSSYLHIVTQKWQELFGIYVGIKEVSSEEFSECIENGDYRIALYPLKSKIGLGSSVIREVENIKPCKGMFGDMSLSESLMICNTADELVDKYSEAEQLIINSYRFIPLFYKNEYLIAYGDNEDIEYDPFTEAIDYRLAQNYS